MEFLHLEAMNKPNTSYESYTGHGFLLLIWKIPCIKLADFFKQLTQNIGLKFKTVLPEVIY